jgi:hypothetical protein
MPVFALNEFCRGRYEASESALMHVFHSLPFVMSQTTCPVLFVMFIGRVSLVAFSHLYSCVLPALIFPQTKLVLAAVFAV